MRVGILGGTFDPPHNGHLKLAHTAIEALNLDEVIVLPANANPLKVNRDMSAGARRLEMCRLAIEGEAKLAVSDIELTRGGKSYAVDTLSELHMVQAADYWFILGMDALKGLPQWKAPTRLIKLTRIAAVTRPPRSDADTLRRLPPEIVDAVDIIAMDPLPISSTDIRERIRSGRDIRGLLPQRVLDYIRRNKLYQAE
jgi:nicotinate-nucleotide adenylyltransferase